MTQTLLRLRHQLMVAKVKLEEAESKEEKMVAGRAVAHLKKILANPAMIQREKTRADIRESLARAILDDCVDTWMELVRDERKENDK